MLAPRPRIGVLLLQAFERLDKNRASLPRIGDVLNHRLFGGMIRVLHPAFQQFRQFLLPQFLRIGSLSWIIPQLRKGPHIALPHALGYDRAK